MFLAAQFNPFYLFLAIFLGILLGMIFTRRGKIDKTKIGELEKKDFMDMKRKGTLVDVRKKAEFESGKIVGAKNYPGSSGSKNQGVRKDIPIFIYDKDGRSAYRIAKQYVRCDACMVYYLKGGYQEYIK